MGLTRMRARVSIHDINQDVAEKTIFHDRALVATNSASLPKGDWTYVPERATKTFTKFLRLASERGMPVEIAVKKITKSPAEFLGMHGRGVVKEGNAADLALFKDDKISHVVVGGSMAVRDGVVTGARAGTIIKKTIT